MRDLLHFAIMLFNWFGGLIVNCCNFELRVMGINTFSNRVDEIYNGVVGTREDEMEYI